MGFQVTFESENAFAQSYQQAESSSLMEQQQRKYDGPIWCACEERPAVEHRMSEEPEVVHGSVPAH